MAKYLIRNNRTGAETPPKYDSETAANADLMILEAATPGASLRKDFEVVQVDDEKENGHGNE